MGTGAGGSRSAQSEKLVVWSQQSSCPHLISCVETACVARAEGGSYDQNGKIEGDRRIAALYNGGYGIDRYECGDAVARDFAVRYGRGRPRFVDV